MAARPSLDDLPQELLLEILSRLSCGQQLAVRRVSRRWNAAVDACLVRRRELNYNTDIPDTGGDTERQLNLLQNMPALRRLCMRPFVMDVPGVERLCSSCPQLEEVHLEGYLGEAGVEALLRGLPALRAFHVQGSVSGCLSLLPTGLQSLSLPGIVLRDPTSLLHVLRCQQLRQLDLSMSRVRSEELARVVAACPQLERLSVESCPRLQMDWLTQLRHCPQLRELDISNLESGFVPRMGNLYLSNMLTTCSRLERLRVAVKGDPLSAFPATILPSLTHLNVSDTLTDDSTFCRLADLLPGLRDLRLGGCDRLTAGGLADGLARFTSLRVLDLRRTRNFTGSEAQLSALMGLPLKALAYSIGRSDIAGAATLLRRCPSVTVLSLGNLGRDKILMFGENVAEDPQLKNRDVFVTTGWAGATDDMLTLPQPRKVHLVPENWTALVGWSWWDFCGCSDHLRDKVEKSLADLRL